MVTVYVYVADLGGINMDFCFDFHETWFSTTCLTAPGVC